MSPDPLSPGHDPKPHSLEMNEVLQRFQSSLAGLSKEEAKERLTTHGPNELKEQQKVSPISIFLNQFKGILVVILLISALVSGLVLSEVLDTIVILSVVLMNAVLGFYQEYRAEKAVEALKRMIAPMARVSREGREEMVPSRELVPGDIMLLDAGDRVAADGRLLEAVAMRVDESSLTGESNPVTKGLEPLPLETVLGDRRNMVFMGTYTTFGRGRAVVTATGQETEFGKIAGMVQEVKTDVSPLSKRVEQMGRQLGMISLSLCMLVLVIGIMIYHVPITEMFMTIISMAVSSIPEGLPAVITVTLSLGVGRMAREKAIVRRLAAVETLGCTSVICSDKTGTLTKNEMTVSRLYNGRGFIEVTGAGYEPRGEFLRDGAVIDPREDRSVRRVLTIGALCNNSSLENKDGSWSITGDSTEASLVTVAAKAGLPREDLNEQLPRIGELPFDADRRMMSTVHKSFGLKPVLYTKGAPEQVLARSVYIEEGDETRRLTEYDKDRIQGASKSMASEALRVLAMAYRDLSHWDGSEADEEVEKRLVFAGLVGMIDPPREEVPEAVRLCNQAGIRTIMITGDHRDTAVAVARRIGMAGGSGLRVLSGEELDRIEDAELTRLVEEVQVYARASPGHKMRIAQALKRNGHVVAMTGDGVNDAPAIKAADIGVAMGIKGTDVTKEASTMILEDDNFATIVSAVEEGRHIYENIKKYIRLMISVNFDEFLEITIAVMAGMPLPLLPIQILWVNLVSDGLPAAALSIDPKEPGLMEKPPRNPKEGLLNRIWKFIFVAASLDCVSSFLPFLWILTQGFTYWGPWGYSDPLTTKARTAAFTAVVFFEFLLVYQCRSESRSLLSQGWKTLTNNRMLLLSILASSTLQLAIVYLPSFHSIFGTTSLTPLEFAISIMGSLLAFLIVPAKLIERPGK